MNQLTNKSIEAAKRVVGPLPDLEDHEHTADCMEVETVEVTSFATPDVDQSYDRQIYVCKVTGKDIDLDEADPEVNAAEAREGES